MQVIERILHMLRVKDCRHVQAGDRQQERGERE